MYDTPSETLESHLENIAWIVISASLLVLSSTAMNQLMLKLDGQRLRAAALLIKDSIELSWQTGCTLEVLFPSSLERGRIRVEVRDRTVIASSEHGMFKTSLCVSAMAAEIQPGKVYRIMRAHDRMEIREVAP